MSGAASPETSSLRARDAALLVDLLTGKSLKEAAANVGISTRQAQRIRSTDGFQRAFSEAKTEMLSAAVGALHSHAMKFVTTLSEVASDEKARGHERVSASREGLTALFKARELLEIEGRLKRLEELASGDGK